jgi:hypothetical protein
MKYYYPLNLPFPLTKNTTLDVLNETVKWYGLTHTNLEEILSPELMEKFSHLGVKPTQALIIGLPTVSSGKTLVHTDITLVDNKWVKIPCGINWEITDSKASWRWLDVKNSQEFYPEQDSGYYEYPRGLNGSIHYNQRYKSYSRDLYPDPYFDTYDVLETLTVNPTQCYLVRTEVPHSIEFESQKSNRIGISVRFDTSQISSWDQAVEIFKPIIDL